MGCGGGWVWDVVVDGLGLGVDVVLVSGGVGVSECFVNNCGKN